MSTGRVEAGGVLTVDWRGSEAQPGGTPTARDPHRGRRLETERGAGLWEPPGRRATCAPPDLGPIRAYTSTGKPATDLRGRPELLIEGALTVTGHTRSTECESALHAPGERFWNA